MREIFDDDECEAVILVDANNAFNSLNRSVALHNIQYVCPPFAPILINTYRNPARLVVNNGRELLSREGTTQGENLAMSFYAVSIKVMLDNLSSLSSNPEVGSVKQVWLADDGTGAGKLQSLKSWWDTVLTEGAKIGFHVNASKFWLIAKDEKF